MGFQRRTVGALLAMGALTAIAAGCGGRSGSSNGETAEVEASKQFLGGGENGKLASFGREADAKEREAASRVLEENLKARASQDFDRQCASLAAGQLRRTEKTRKFFRIKGGCAEGLESQAEVAPPAALRNTMTGSVVALRVAGNRGFAFYHGTGGKDYAMAMQKEGGEWKVGSLTEKEVP
jgi:hypothetical protein